MPAEALVARARLIDELIDDDAVLLVLAEAELVAAGGAHRIPALVGEELAQARREERGEGEAIDVTAAVGARAVADRNAVDRLPVGRDPLGLDASELVADHLDLRRRGERGEV